MDINNQNQIDTGNSLIMNKPSKHKFVIGHILNIFSVAIILVCFIAVKLPDIIVEKMDIPEQSIQEEVADDPDFSINVIVEPEVEYQHARAVKYITYACFAVGTLTFIIGLFLYANKNIKIKTILAYLYLVLSVANFIVWTVTHLEALFCIFSMIIFVPGILQIIAGIQFVLGAILYEK